MDDRSRHHHQQADDGADEQDCLGRISGEAPETRHAFAVLLGLPGGEAEEDAADHAGDQKGREAILDVFVGGLGVVDVVHFPSSGRKTALTLLSEGGHVPSVP